MISLRNVTKRFKLYQQPADRFFEWCHLGTRHREFYALRNINLEVPEGRTIGIVGANGAGKSTLLKLVTGTLLPTEGEIEIGGRIAALLELGTGFHPDFTGRQNIYINGQLLGLSQAEIASIEEEIIEFSELGPFIDQPLRTYSSGMVVRLGFAVAASVNPDILIIDEALSVGDARFSQKCTRRIQNFRDRGTTILFVSHDPTAILSLCDEAILLETGQVRSRGLPRDVLDEYNALLAAKGTGNVAMRISRASRESATSGLRRHGTLEALISRLQMLDDAGNPRDSYHPGETMKLRLRVTFLSPIQNPSIGFVIKDRLGLSLYGTNTILKGIAIGACQRGEAVDVEANIPLNFGYGNYYLTVAVHEDENHLHACYEWIDNAAVFSIRHEGKPDWTGLTLLHPQLTAARCRMDAEELANALAERFGAIPDPLTLEERDPSPFLSGFDAPSRHGRKLNHEATVVLQPRHPYLHVRVVREEMAGNSPRQHAPPTLAMESLDDAWRGNETLVPPGDSTLVFELPAPLMGRLMIFRLMLRQAEDAQGVWIQGMQTLSTPQEHAEWPITMPTKS